MKWTQVLLPVFALIFITGCGSSKKYLEKGNYDTAINMAVANLRKNPTNEKQIEILEKSMNIALEHDNDRIRYLKMEGRADAWDEIFLIYKKMDDRQKAVRTVTPLQLHGRTIEWPYVDYMQEMIGAKKKAADFYFAHGQELMKNGTKESYRQAYDEFFRAKEYMGDYPDIDRLLGESRYLGISRVYVDLKNHSLIKFPEKFEKELLALDLPRLNSEWVEYHTDLPSKGADMDYQVTVNIRTVTVSPDHQFQRDTLMKKTVEDGYEYVKDDKGNVVKDAEGNDVRVAKTKDLQCALIQTFQVKECTILGDVEMKAFYPEQTLKKEPIVANAAFEHVSARAIGDAEILSEEQKKMLDSAILEFPPDIEMILRTTETLKAAIRLFMEANRKLIY